MVVPQEHDNTLQTGGRRNLTFENLVTGGEPCFGDMGLCSGLDVKPEQPAIISHTPSEQDSSTMKSSTQSDIKFQALLEAVEKPYLPEIAEKGSKNDSASEWPKLQQISMGEKPGEAGIYFSRAFL